MILTKHGCNKNVIIDTVHLFLLEQFKQQLQEEQDLRKAKEEEVKALQGNSVSLVFTK